MTGNTLEQRARELLAAEYKIFGFTRGAEALLAGRSDTFDQCALRAVEAALRLSAGADWVLVPREPTPEMLDAGWAEGAKLCESGAPDFAAAWTAMLAAVEKERGT